MVWYSYLFQNFPQFIVIHTVKGFGIVNKAEIDVFLELSCFFNDPVDVGNFISCSSAFYKTNYTQLNAEFQRTVKRDKKAFFNEQCLKIEENNRRGKTRDLFRKIGNTEGTFCPKMGTIKDRNGGDLVEAEKNQEEMERICRRTAQKNLNDLDNHNGVVITQSQTFQSVNSGGS